MTLTDILSRLDKVSGNSGRYMARCPAHEDNKPSLSVSVGEDGRILMHCHAGCSTEDIVYSMGLTMRDLFEKVTPEDAFPTYSDTDVKTASTSKSVEKNTKMKRSIVATYRYPSGSEKLRYQDKSFSWRCPDGKGGWIWKHPDGKRTPIELYVAGTLDPEIPVFVVEGEKDADRVHKIMGNCAVCGMDGAGKGKWKKEYTEQLRGFDVNVIPDNDEVGKAFATETCNALHGVAKVVHLLDLSAVWPEIQEHDDISDLAALKGDEEAADLLVQLCKDAKEWSPDDEKAEDNFLSLFKPLEDFKEEEATWLIPGWIPEGQITLIAADGGVGKTSLWCTIIAALSSGKASILDPYGFTREPKKVAFLTTEDSVKKKLRKKLREAGANMKNIITMDLSSDKEGELRDFKFGSPKMRQFVKHFATAATIFDPVQGFVPPEINMGSRNAMRDCMAPLITLGEEVGTTFLVICHTNKRRGAYGRDRIADSADLWDISRSVIMMGYTKDMGVRYLSNEKNNYAPLQETILYTMNEDGKLCKEGTSWKRDREYMQESVLAKAPTKREDCKAFVLRMLEEAPDHSLKTEDLTNMAQLNDYSFSTLKRIKAELNREGITENYSIGNGTEKTWYFRLKPLDESKAVKAFGALIEADQETLEAFSTPSA